MTKKMKFWPDLESDWMLFKFTFLDQIYENVLLHMVATESGFTFSG